MSFNYARPVLVILDFSVLLCDRADDENEDFSSCANHEKKKQTKKSLQMVAFNK